MAKRATVPADGLLHPVAAGCILLLLANDHFLKSAFPGLVTGKLSDIAGLVFFPLFVQAAWETLMWGLRRWQGPDRRILITATILTGIGFTLIQIWPVASDAYRIGLAAGQWPFLSLVAWEWLPLQPVHLTPDVTDLLALPALVVPVWLYYGRDRLPPRSGSHLSGSH